MAMDARRRQKAAEKRKKREKRISEEKTRQRSAAQGAGRGAAAVFASQLPLVECVISKGWEKRGLAHVLLTRRLPDGNLLVGGWYVDTLCLGLKETAVIPNVSDGDYEENVKPQIFNDAVEFIPCEPGLARAVVEGAIAFAATFGFRPHKRWSETRPLLGEDAPPAKAAKLVFGRKGKPCYVRRGESNAQGIVARLARTVGEGNYLVEEAPAD